MKKQYAFIATAILTLGGLGLTPNVVSAQIKPTTSITASTPRQGTVASFQTDTYSVKVFRRGNQLRMNLLDKRTNRLKLNAVPVTVKKSSQQTSYSASQGNSNYLISVGKDGTNSVQILSPNESIQEMISTN
ncbi:MAG: hypothetical protein SAK29_38980 [Scytonema sp. PMC 1069.18]|nr:hypothetical protein [Scytonema sp. PMC 1069.18]MEC4879911.1 hypothetical protein [Scytonema sp. PMC 1070.18]